MKNRIINKISVGANVVRQRYKGITLISLVITIIIILILAGVGIYGSLALIEQARYSAFINEMKQVDEAVVLTMYERRIQAQLEGQPYKIFPDELKFTQEDVEKLPLELKYEILYIREKVKEQDVTSKLPTKQYYNTEELDTEGMYYVDNTTVEGKEEAYIYDEQSASVYKIEPTIIWGVEMHGYEYGNLLTTQSGLLERAKKGNKDVYPEVNLSTEIVEENSSVNIIVTAKEEKNGIVKIELINNGEYEEYESEKGEIIKKFNVDENGEYKIKVTTAKEVYLIEKITVAGVGPTAPILEIIAGDEGENDWYKTNVEIKVTQGIPRGGAEIEKTTYKVINTKENKTIVEETTIPNNGTIQLTSDGEYKIVAYTYDTENNVSIGTELEIKKDEIAPEKVTLTNEMITDITVSSFNINIETQDATSGIEKYEYYTNSTKHETKLAQNLTAETTYSVYVKVYDKAGNVMTTNQISVTTISDKDYITYDANGGENAPESQNSSNNKISTVIPTKEGYTFAGWGTTSDTTEITYKGGETYTGQDSITLYAIWLEKIEYLESNGMQYIDTEYYPNQDTSIEFIATPTKLQNRNATGWFGGRYDSNDSSDQRSYSFWEISGKFYSYYNNENNGITSINVSANTKYTIYINKNITNINGVKYKEATYGSFESPSTLTLFGVKTYTASSMYNSTDSVEYRMASLKLYSCKIWDNGTLIRDYIPVKDFNGTECLYDNQNKKFYYLESNITQVEYIQSTGTQYIDTGYYPNQDTSIEFVAIPTVLPDRNATGWFGGRNTSDSSVGQMAYAFWESSQYFLSYYNNESNKITSANAAINVKYTIYINKNITYINGLKCKEATYSSFESPATLTLFGVKTYATTGYNSANSVDNRIASLKLYSCKIWDNGTLIRDYIPVKDFNGTACLYDKVEGIYYYNSGAGSFTASE